MTPSRKKFRPFLSSKRICCATSEGYRVRSRARVFFYSQQSNQFIRQGDIDVLREVTLADLIQLLQRSGGCSALSRPCRAQRVENNRCHVSLGEFRVSSSSPTCGVQSQPFSTFSPSLLPQLSLGSSSLCFGSSLLAYGDRDRGRDWGWAPFHSTLPPRKGTYVWSRQQRGRVGNDDDSVSRRGAAYSKLLPFPLLVGWRAEGGGV